MFRILTKAELASFVQGLPISPVVGVLLMGDRLSCCDEAVALEIDGEIIGVSTIAPQGEQGSGQPTLVGLYVKPEFRRKGYGYKLAEAGIRRCIERGFERVRVDVMSSYAARILEKLPENLKNILDIYDMGDMMDFLAMSETLYLAWS